MTLKTNIQSIFDKGRPRACGAALVFFIFIAVFGIYNDANLFWAHCRIAEWGLLLFISLVFVRNIWLKSFLVLCLARPGLRRSFIFTTFFFSLSPMRF